MPRDTQTFLNDTLHRRPDGALPILPIFAITTAISRKARHAARPVKRLRIAKFPNEPRDTFLICNLGKQRPEHMGMLAEHAGLEFSDEPTIPGAIVVKQMLRVPEMGVHKGTQSR